MSGVPIATGSPSTGLDGYPKPVFIQGSKRVSGYYLDQDYKDTAVLVLPGFDPSSLTNKDDPATAGFVESQRLLRTFFADAVKSGKKRLYGYGHRKWKVRLHIHRKLLSNFPMCI